jgi:hypothetical protein
LYLEKIKGAQTAATIQDVVKHYSTYNFEKQEEIKLHVESLRKAAQDTSKFRMIGVEKTYMKHPMIEKYGAYAIDLGIQNEMDTELNMSPEGKLRRKALY